VEKGRGAQTLGYIPALDGVRGLAIALVLCVHLWLFWRGDTLIGGHEGVTVFFVLPAS
jgi:peptidoglycan/LPS O-acetylase OafA/YrhL